MSNDLVRQSLELDDHLSAPAAKPSRDFFSKSRKKRERAKRARVAKPAVTPDLVERNVKVALRNVKSMDRKKKFIKKLELSQVPRWHQPLKKKRKKKKSSDLPDSAYDISDVKL